MKKYAYIKDGKVNQFLYAFSKDFPNVPLDKMFEKTIVKNCVEIDENDDTIKEGMDYNWETGVFSEHIDEEVPETLESEEQEEIINERAEE